MSKLVPNLRDYFNVLSGNDTLCVLKLKHVKRCEVDGSVHECHTELNKLCYWTLLEPWWVLIMDKTLAIELGLINDCFKCYSQYLITFYIFYPDFLKLLNCKLLALEKYRKLVVQLRNIFVICVSELVLFMKRFRVDTVLCFKRPWNLRSR